MVGTAHGAFAHPTNRVNSPSPAPSSRPASPPRASAASRPEARISSDNSPLPAMRDITSVPIMVASVRHRLLARRLARHIRNLIGHHVDHLFELGG